MKYIKFITLFSIISIGIITFYADIYAEEFNKLSCSTIFDDSLDVFPEYVNLEGISELNLHIEEIKTNYSSTNMLKLEYDIQDYGNIKITIDRTRKWMQINSLYPGLPSHRRLGVTLLWILLTNNNQWAGYEVYVYRASKPFERILDLMEDFVAPVGKQRKVKAPYDKGYFSYHLKVPRLRNELSCMLDQFIIENVVIIRKKSYIEQNKHSEKQSV